MPTEEQIKKLPKWAREHIHVLMHQRDVALRQLDKMEETQAVSKVWADEFVESRGGNSIRRRYFDADSLTIQNGGVILDINGLHREKEGIRLTWRPEGKGYAIGNVFFIPKAYQQAQLISPDYA